VNNAVAELGVPVGIRGSFSGTAGAFQSALAGQPLLILAAIITIYLVLGILYENLVHPITILSTLPSAGVGALLALMLFKTEFSLIALIGVILLIGIVKKNAIMMIDFALARQRDGYATAAQSIYRACSLRLRPILMTTMAAIFGALPLALNRARRRRAAPTPGHCRGGWAAGEPAAHAVHHARGVCEKKTGRSPTTCRTSPCGSTFGTLTHVESPSLSCPSGHAFVGLQHRRLCARRSACACHPRHAFLPSHA
jgi:hypothetical protein